MSFSWCNQWFIKLVSLRTSRQIQTEVSPYISSTHKPCHGTVLWSQDARRLKNPCTETSHPHFPFGAVIYFETIFQKFLLCFSKTQEHNQCTFYKIVKIQSFSFYLLYYYTINLQSIPMSLKCLKCILFPSSVSIDCF